MRRIDVRRGTENFKALFPTEFELCAKNQQGGPFGPPLIRSRVNLNKVGIDYGVRVGVDSGGSESESESPRNSSTP